MASSGFSCWARHSTDWEHWGDWGRAGGESLEGEAGGERLEGETGGGLGERDWRGRLGERDWRRRLEGEAGGGGWRERLEGEAGGGDWRGRLEGERLEGGQWVNQWSLFPCRSSDNRGQHSCTSLLSLLNSFHLTMTL